MVATIKRLAKEQGKSIAKLEKQAGLSNGSISKWDDHAPQADRLQRVAYVLGVTSEYLLDPRNEKSPVQADSPDGELENLIQRLLRLPPEQRKKLFDSCGAPGEAWENAGDFESFETATATIRERELSVMTNEDEGIKSFAVPIFDPDRKICASLALTLPISQLAADGGSSLTRTLHRTSRTIAAQLGVMEFSAADFIHIV